MFDHLPVGYRPAVVVLNMHYTGLGVARALRGADVDVVGLSFDDTFVGNRSRLCRFERYPDPSQEPDAAGDFLLALARRFPKPPLLIPTRDLDLEFLLAWRTQLEPGFLLPLAPTPVLNRILDKSSLVSVARSVGIDAPVEARVTAEDELEPAWQQIRGPCIVKPVRASQWRGGRIVQALDGRKVATCETLEELRAFYRRISAFDPLVLVQEFIPGSDADLTIFGSYTNPRSKLVRYFTARKIIQSPPQSGTGIVVRSEPIPAIVESSLRLLRALEYSGISEIEYKFDRRTGRHVLIEVNTRHWDQHALGLACGVNLTRVLYGDVCGESIPEMQQSSRPVSWIGEAGYLIGLRDILRGRGYSLGRYLAALRGRRAWATFAWSDPRPGVFLLARVFSDYLGSLGRWMRGLATGRSR